MTDPAATIDRLVSKSAQLYSLPAVAMQVLELTGQPELDTHALRQCIENDPALTTKILRVVNSSLFGLGREVLDLGQALTLLGTKPLKLLVLGFSLPDGLFAGVGGEVLGRYWRHTLTKAVAAREIAETVWQKPGDDAFIVGLLQDLGQLVLVREVGRPYLDFVERAWASGGDLIALERQAMGFDHTELTAQFLRQWGLPKLLVSNVAWRDVHAAAHDSSPSAPPLPKILHLAELTARLLVGGGSDLLSEVLATGVRYRQLSAPQLDTLVANLEEKVAQLADVLRLELPAGHDFHEVLVNAHLQLAEAAAEAVTDLAGRARSQSSPRADATEWREPMQTLSQAIAKVSQPSCSSPLQLAVCQSASNVADAQPALVAVAPVPLPKDEAGADPGLIGRLAVAAAACRQSRCPLSLLLVEAGNLDQQGVLVGVEGRQAIEALLEKACHDIDHACAICVRSGDAGFALILPDCDRHWAARLGNDLQAEVARATEFGALSGGQRLQVGLGLATVSMPPKNFPPQDLFEAASRCLYASHHSGGNVVKSIEIY